MVLEQKYPGLRRFPQRKTIHDLLRRQFAKIRLSRGCADRQRPALTPVNLGMQYRKIASLDPTRYLFTGGRFISFYFVNDHIKARCCSRAERCFSCPPSQTVHTVFPYNMAFPVLTLRKDVSSVVTLHIHHLKIDGVLDPIWHGRIY